VNRPKPPPAQLSDGRRHTTSVSFDPVKCVLSRRSALEGPQGHVDAGWDMRFYVLPELVELLTGLGFRVERVYGGCDGSAYGLASQRMVAISRKT